MTDIVILALLLLGPRHGYEIKKDIGRIMQARSRLNNNLLYPALHRLEKMGAVEGRIEEQEGKPARHVYWITAMGREVFQDLIGQFSETDAAKDEEFLARLAFFDMVDSPTRQRILAERKRQLARQLDNRKSLGAEYAPGFGALMDSVWVDRLLGFEQQRLADEIAWIEELETLARTPGAKKGDTHA